MTVSSSPPVVDGADVAQLVGTTDIGGNPGHVWSNRPRQGQSFTTGVAAAEYVLTAITVRARVDQASTTSPNWEFRLGSLDGANVFSPLATENSVGVPIPNGIDNWVTWTLDTPQVLAPNTLYGYDVYPSGGGYISLNSNPNGGDIFLGGGACSRGSAFPAVGPHSEAINFGLGSDFAISVWVKGVRDGVSPPASPRPTTS